MLWFLHLCADAGIVVESYEDNASGVLVTAADGGGRFTQVTLRPRVKAKGDAGPIAALHERAHKLCFLANSVNFPVLREPVARA
jgi:organic hydroperoxide reductase OsmC/OhrA